MKSEDYEKKIIEKLNKMPKVTDQMNKDELYKRISTKMQVNKARQNKKRVLIPVFGTALVIGILLFIFPFFINDNSQQTSENRSTDESFDSASEKMMDQMDEDSQEESIVAEYEVAHIESYVVQTVDENSTIIYGAVADKQSQYVIPLSIIVPDTTDLNHYYNNLEDYLQESEWGVNDYLFENVIFDFDLSNNQVGMDLPVDFTVSEGSAEAYIFAELLESMFNPHLIEKVVFMSDQEIDLGPFGNITELALNGEAKVNYKVFQASEDKRRFLIPIKQGDEITIEEAIADMKNSAEALNVYQTIPGDAEFVLTSSNDELFIVFDNDSEYTGQQEMLTMIEAILMTAKSFGYDSVKLENIDNNQIGPYDLSESIDVPEAINPIN